MNLLTDNIIMNLWTENIIMYLSVNKFIIILSVTKHISCMLWKSFVFIDWMQEGTVYWMFIYINDNYVHVLYLYCTPAGYIYCSVVLAKSPDQYLFDIMSFGCKYVHCLSIPWTLRKIKNIRIYIYCNTSINVYCPLFLWVHYTVFWLDVI